MRVLEKSDTVLAMNETRPPSRKGIIDRFKGEKRKRVIILGFLVLGTGLIPSLILTFSPVPSRPYAVNGISLVSQDGTRIAAISYVPLFPTPDKSGIVVAHGFCGNKHGMQPLSIELVKNGFHVVSIDFRGHGSSSGYLLSIDDSEGLGMDVMAAVEHLMTEHGISRLGLVGHSMGGRTMMAVASEHPSLVNATVSIGMITTAYNSSHVPNLMMAIGKYEQLFSQDMAIEALKAYTGIPEPETGIVYGDFSAGTASKVVVGPCSEHLLEIVDPVIVGETVSWFLNAFSWPGDAVVNTSSILVAFICVTCAGGVYLVLAVTAIAGHHFLKDQKEKKVPVETGNPRSITKPVSTYLFANVVSLAGLFMLPRLFSDVLPVTMFNYVYSLSFVGIVLGIVIALVLHAVMRRTGAKGITSWFTSLKASIHVNAREFAFGLAAGAFLVGALVPLLHWSIITTVPTLREAGTMVAISLLCFPFIVVKEHYLRNVVQDRVAARITKGSATARFVKEYMAMGALGVFMETIIFVPVMFLLWQSPRMAFGALSLTIFILFNAIQQLLVTWMYIAGNRNFVSSSIFNAILVAWMVVNFFPFGLARTIF